MRTIGLRKARRKAVVSRYGGADADGIPTGTRTQFAVEGWQTPLDAEALSFASSAGQVVDSAFWYRFDSARQIKVGDHLTIGTTNYVVRTVNIAGDGINRALISFTE